MLITIIAKVLGNVSKLLRTGAGATWPGHLICKFYPQFLNKSLKKFNNGLVYITGTNGKTTTTSFVARFLTARNLSVVTNSTGANLSGGVASSIVSGFDYLGRSSFCYGIFEIDEGAAPFFLKQCFPDVLVFLNLSRDQLDRYGEPDITLERIVEVLEQASKKVVVIYNPLDEFLTKHPKITKNPNIVYRVIPEEETFIKVNKTAAVMALEGLGFKGDLVRRFVENLGHAFGRGEEITFKNCQVSILLAKNPASFNANLSLVVAEKPQKEFTPIFILNDNIPDGRDVSWIYDIDSALLQKVCKKARDLVFITGTRAWDFSLRLVLAGTSPDSLVVDTEIDTVLNKATSKGGYVTVFPTYSAMLETRKFLLGRKIP